MSAEELEQGYARIYERLFSHGQNRLERLYEYDIARYGATARQSAGRRRHIEAAKLAASETLGWEGEGPRRCPEIGV